MRSDLLQRNLRTLTQCRPQLARRVRELASTPHLQLHATTAGTPTLVVTSPDGGRLALHSTENPIAESHAWVQHNAQTLTTRPLILVMGTGLGYHLPLLKQLVPVDSDCGVPCARPELLQDIAHSSLAPTAQVLEAWTATGSTGQSCG